MVTMKTKGFTLIELLVVLGIVALMLTLAAVSYTHLTLPTSDLV